MTSTQRSKFMKAHSNLHTAFNHLPKPRYALAALTVFLLILVALTLTHEHLNRAQPVSASAMGLLRAQLRYADFKLQQVDRLDGVAVPAAVEVGSGRNQAYQRFADAKWHQVDALETAPRVVPRAGVLDARTRYIMFKQSQVSQIEAGGQ
jgi:hypothetical protein